MHALYGYKCLYLCVCEGILSLLYFRVEMNLKTNYAHIQYTPILASVLSQVA